MRRASRQNGNYRFVSKALQTPKRSDVLASYFFYCNLLCNKRGFSYFTYPVQITIFGYKKKEIDLCTLQSAIFAVKVTSIPKTLSSPQQIWFGNCWDIPKEQSFSFVSQSMFLSNVVCSFRSPDGRYFFNKWISSFISSGICRAPFFYNGITTYLRDRPNTIYPMFVLL